MKTYANIYYRARMQAAQREPLHASRERTASEIFVSCEALADYETGRTVPPCDVVQKMVEAYNDPDLKAAHIRACCPLLPDYGGEGCSELARAALGWAIAFQSAQDIALQFATVARDGRITQDELPAAQTIRVKAVELRRIMEETIAAIDKATSGQTKAERRRRIEIFLHMLEEQKECADFEPGMFVALVDKVIIQHDGHMGFCFRNGMKCEYPQ